MDHVLLVLLPGAEPARRELTGPLSAGGSRADAIHLPGAPPGALRLVPCAAGVLVEAVAPGVRAGGHPVAPGARRLLRGGERAELHEAALELAPGEGTRARAGALLREAAGGAPPGERLVVITGPGAGARVALRGGPVVVGRGRRAALRLRDPQASRAHARVTLTCAGAAVEDLRSRNGVLVNGVRIDRSPRLLRHGDELRIGETVLALEDPWSGPDAAPRPRAGLRPGTSHALAAALLALSAAAVALAAVS